MPIETADDLASFFDDDEFAESATWTPPGADAVAVPCIVIVDRGQGRSRSDRMKPEAVGTDRRVMVRRLNPQADDSVAEIIAVRDGLFTVAGTFGGDLAGGVAGGADETLKVTGLPVLDETGRVWTCDVLQVTG